MYIYHRKEITESWERALTISILLRRTSIQFRVVPHGTKLFFVFKDLRIFLRYPAHGTKARREFERTYGNCCIKTVRVPIEEASHYVITANLVPLDYAELFICRRVTNDHLITELQNLIKSGEFRAQLKQQLGTMYSYLNELDERPNIDSIIKRTNK